VQVRGEGRDEEGTGSGPVLRRPDGGPGIAASATGAATYALTGRRDGWGTPAAPRRPITIPPAPREAPAPQLHPVSDWGGHASGRVSRKKPRIRRPLEPLHARRAQRWGQAVGTRP